MINAFQQGNQNNLLNIVDITCDYIRYILSEEDPVRLVELKEYFLRYSNIKKAFFYQIPLGGGLYEDKYEFLEPNSDLQVAGLESLLAYLDFNFRKKMTIQ